MTTYEAGYYTGKGILSIATLVVAYKITKKIFKGNRKRPMKIFLTILTWSFTLYLMLVYWEIYRV